MSVLVDTSVWSLSLRHRASKASRHARVLRGLIEEGRVRMLGPIRQELLSGIAHAAQFERLEELLDAFPDEPIERRDYVSAAQMFNTCRGRGVQGSHIDFLLCAVAARLNDDIYTADTDFKRYAKHLPIRLFSIAQR